MSALPAPLASATLAERLLARLGFVRFHRYTDRLALTESQAVRLDSALAAMDAQRARLAELQDKLNRANATICDQIDALTNREDAFTELRGELAAAEQERDEALARLASVPDSPEPAPLRLDPATHRKALDLLRAHGAHDELLPHAVVLLDHAVFDRLNLAQDERLSDAETKYHLGGARALLEFKGTLAAAIAPERP